MFKITPLNALDFYKTDHRRQYPPNTQMVYSNLTARSDRLTNLPNWMNYGRVTFFGLQYFLKGFLQELWRDGFFNQPRDKVVRAYKRRLDTSLTKDAIPMDHIEALHELGYLPLAIRALPEGSQVPIKVPLLTIHNTDKRFGWLTNYMETALSAETWKPIVSATTAYAYRREMEFWGRRTGTPSEFIKWQGHDFSMRGMSGISDAAISGAAHLTCFTGTDTVPAIDLLEQYYYADSEREIVGGSVAATEHSVMCMGTPERELDTFHRLLTKVYPTGIISVVSDSYDYWRAVTDYARELKDVILARDGKLVFRPDSGDPEKIICGDPYAPEGTPQHKGTVECLWEIFGGTELVGYKQYGYRVLDPHVGVIYGDSITPIRATHILGGLFNKGYSTSNVVLGLGSYGYQHVTRDTWGLAMKATYGEVDGKGIEIFKSPKTDKGGDKKSARGLLRVVKDEDGDYMLLERQDRMGDDETRLVYQDGELFNQTTLAEIRARVDASVKDEVEARR